MQTAQRLAAIGRRAACTDAERRAAVALARDLRAGGRRARIETHWVHPSGALAHAVHAVLALAASILSVDVPVAGLVLAVLALALLLGELSGRAPLTRRLLGRRATQNVVSEPRERGSQPVRLVVTAAVDAPGTGVLRRVDARLRGWVPAIQALSTFAILLAATARVSGADERWLGALQLPPTIVLVLLAGGWVDAATSRPARGSGAGGGAAVAVALAAALDAVPPRALSVEVVLAGAGHAEGALGFGRLVRERRREVAPEEVAVLHLDACGTGAPRFWFKDGLLVRPRLHPRLVALAHEAAERERHVGATAHAARGSSAALSARRAGWPAIAISGDPAPDPAADAEPEALAATFELALGLVRALDRDLLAGGAAAEQRPAAPAPAAG